MGIKRFRKHLLGLLGTILVLTGCGTTQVQPPANTEIELNTQRHNLVFEIEISNDDRLEDIETAYKAQVVVWQADAGFAILTGSEGEHLKQQNVLAEQNIDMVSSPTLDGLVYANGAYGSGAYGSGAYGSGAYGSGAYGAGAYGSGAYGSGAYGSGTFRAGVNSGYLLNNLDEWNKIELFSGHLAAKNLGDGVKIAVIDTGIDLDHSLLVNNLAPTVEWVDYVDADYLPEDELGGLLSGHGTGVTGIILQVAPKAQILPLRVLGANGTGDTSDVAAAIAHAANSGVDIINLSLGIDENSTVLKKMLSYAASKGIYVFAATGNAGQAKVDYPASYSSWNELVSSLFGIGSSSLNDEKSRFSNYGAGLSFYSLGETIHTIFPGELWIDSTGTSFSTPIASGQIALLLGENRNANVAQQIGISTTPVYASSQGLLNTRILLGGAILKPEISTTIAVPVKVDDIDSKPVTP